jgi:hypothetical protein
MDRQQFFRWMNDPASLNAESAGELQEIILNYPYFQTARVLQLINLKLLKDYRFERELRRVAGFAADRTKLRDMLISIEETVSRPDQQLKAEPVSPATKEDQKKDIHLSELEEQIKASLREIELKKSHLKELLHEKESITGEKELIKVETDETFSKMPLRPLPKDQLLEDYIRQNETTPIRPNFFNAEETAKKSIEDNEDILSETLARLVAAQGKKEKAIKIYQQLMLKYPQKSSTFAAQIEKLRKEQ